MSTKVFLKRGTTEPTLISIVRCLIWWNLLYERREPVALFFSHANLSLLTNLRANAMKMCPPPSRSWRKELIRANGNNLMRSLHYAPRREIQCTVFQQDWGKKSAWNFSTCYVKLACNFVLFRWAPRGENWKWLFSLSLAFVLTTWHSSSAPTYKIRLRSEIG